VGGTLAARFTTRLRRLCPRVALRVVSGGGGYLLKWLESQEIDLAVVYEPSAPSHLDVRPLLEEPLHLIGPASVEAALPACVPMATLAELPLILPSAQHALRVLIDRAAAAAGVALSVIVEADSMEMQKELVGAGIGWTVLPAAALGHDPAAVWFSVREIAAPHLVRRLALALPLRPKRPRAVDLAAEILIREVRELVGDNRWPGARLLTSSAAGRKA
jgi:DNA-binding transcriptional LysR family regulator